MENIWGSSVQIPNATISTRVKVWIEANLHNLNKCFIKTCPQYLTTSHDKILERKHPQGSFIFLLSLVYVLMLSLIMLSLCLWGFPCVSGFSFQICYGVFFFWLPMGVNKQRSLYSANLFPVLGPPSECRYCLIIYVCHEMFVMRDAILYIKW